MAEYKIDISGDTDALKKAAKDAQQILTGMEAARKQASKNWTQAEIDAEAKVISARQAMGRKTLTDEQAQLLARTQMHQRSNQQMVDSAVKGLQAQRDSWLGVAGAAGMVKNLVGSVVGQIGAALAVTKLVNLAVEEWSAQLTRVNEQHRAGNELLLKQASISKELAIMGGTGGNTAAQMVKTLALRQASLMTTEEAVRFEQGVMNRGQTAITGRMISKADMAELTKYGGALTTATGAEAGPVGELIGSLPALGRATAAAPLTAAAGKQQLSAYYNAFLAGGSNLSSAVRQFTANQAYATQPEIFSNAIDAAIVQSAFSLASPDEAGTLMNQFVRATTGAIGKGRGVKQLEGDTARVGEYVRGLGVTDQMTAPEIGSLIGADLMENKRIAEAQGLKFNQYAYLRTKGYGNEEDIKSLFLYGGMARGGQLGEIARAAYGGGDELDKAIRTYQGGDFEAQQRKADLLGEMRKMGKGSPMGAAIEKIAYENYAQQHDMSYTYEQMTASDWGSRAWFAQGTMAAALKEHFGVAAKAAGIDLPAMDMSAMSMAERRDAAAALYDRLQQAPALGGPAQGTTGPVADAAGKVVQGLKQVADHTKALVDQGAKQAQGAAPALPIRGRPAGVARP